MIDLPLFRRELIEQAARKSTYAIRTVYATLLFGVFLFVYAGGQEAALGQGSELLEALVITQFVGIYLFVPALFAGAVSAEKENGSLGLLFLTDLGPASILFQKLLGRLVPMVTVAMLAMPLMALAYSLGGVTTFEIESAVFHLALACVQTAAIALFFSAFCGTAVSALISTYIFGALFFLVGPVLLHVLYVGVGALFDGWGHFREGLVLSSSLRDQRDQPVVIAASLFPMDLHTRAVDWGFVGWSWNVRHALPAIASIFFFLALTRLVFVRRAFVRSTSLLMGFLRAIDRGFHRLNERLGGVVVVRDREDLPDAEPIAWREGRKKALGNSRYLTRILLVLELPVVCIGLFELLKNPMARAWNAQSEVLSACILALWGFAAVTLIVAGVNAVASERSQGTLGILMTTPITGREFATQKCRGMRRLRTVFLVPFVTLFLFEAIVERYSVPSAVAYLGVSTALIAFFMPLFSWAGIWFALRFENRVRAIVSGLVALVLWAFTPLSLGLPLVVVGMENDWPLSMPAIAVLPILVLGLPFAAGVAAGWIAFVSERACSNADRALGRVLSPSWYAH